jgi:hypothetical protein
MARYNSVSPVRAITTTATIPTPTAGAITSLTGTAPYTVTLASPTLYTGIAQTFYNSTSVTITLTSPTGNLKGPGFTTGSLQTIPSGATYMIMSDGTDYVITNNEGGPQIMTTLTVSSTLTAQAGVSLTGASIATSSTQSVSGTYDVINKNYLEIKYGQSWSVQSSNFNATAGGRYWVDTNSNAVTMTLPSSPTLGDMVQVIDYSGTFSARNLTVANNSNKIMRITDSMTVSTNGAAFTLVWSGATNGWLMATGI